MNTEAPGYGALRCERGDLPLMAMHVQARVHGVTSAIEIAQTFINSTGVVIEATYIFPLPDRAAVNRFRMVAGTRVVEGVIAERDAARASYDAAIGAGRQAAIAEQDQPGVFTLRVGNLMPGETAVVHLGLVGQLPVDDGEVTFRFPLVVAPRYAAEVSPPVDRNPAEVTVRVILDDERVFELPRGARMDRDFVARWRIGRDELTSQLVIADDNVFMLTVIPPPTTAVAQKPRDVVFLLDRSGSMAGWKMVCARRACARMIDTLTARDRFAAIAFDTVFDEKSLAPATDRERFAAIEELAGTHARGGTELAPALAHAVSLVRHGYEDRERIVVVITDGQVGNETELVALASQTKARIHTLGIDQAVNAALLRRLAMIGGGMCELVDTEARLDEVMAKVHRRIGTPIVTELALSATGLDLDRESLTPMSHPGRLPDLHAGAPVVIMGRYRGTAAPDAAITVDGTSFGAPFRTVVTRTRTSPQLAASWAHGRIRDLEDRHAVGAHHVAAEIVRISKQHNVLSKLTAFLAVSDGRTVTDHGPPRSIVQTVEPPAGWQVGSVITLPPRIAITQPGRAGDSSSVRMRFAPAAPRAAKQKPKRAPVSRPEIDASAYLATLREIATVLAAATPEQVQIIRQRLVQWIEDAHAIGLFELAFAVEDLLPRFSIQTAVALRNLCK